MKNKNTEIFINFKKRWYAELGMMMSLIFFLNTNVLFAQESISIKNNNQKHDSLFFANLPKCIVVENKDAIFNIRGGRSTDNITQTKENNNFDVSLFRTINSNRSNFKDAVIPVFDRSMMPVVVLMPVATFAYGRAYNKTYDENTGYLLAGSEITNFALTIGIKMIVKRKRPYASLKNVYREDFSTTDPYSFPSGHTSASFNLATMFALRYPKYPQVYAPMYIWTLIIGYGRPYLGMHYPTDVLGGALIGAGSAVLVYSLRSSLFKLKNNILKENKTDEGSINGGTVTIFTGSFLVSSVFNQIFFHNNKIQFNFSPASNDKTGMNLEMNWKF